ncbi:MAG: hypothetical protein ACR2IE_08320 [Candidatus Sumerlaeaceae bacterium]
MTYISFLALLLVAVPPKGVCLREMLTHSRCCMAAVTSLCSLARSKPCCDSCAQVSQKQDSPRPFGSPDHGQPSGTCFVSPATLFVSPTGNLSVEYSRLVTVDVLPLESLPIQLASPISSHRIGWYELHYDIHSPALNRGSSILRI